MPQVPVALPELHLVHVLLRRHDGIGSDQRAGEDPTPAFLDANDERVDCEIRKSSARTKK